MPKPNHLKFNDPAPDMKLQDIDRNPVNLFFPRKKRALILAITCHFSRSRCKEMLMDWTKTFNGSVALHE
jgi:hypothetical protein